MAHDGSAWSRAPDAASLTEVCGSQYLAVVRLGTGVDVVAVETGLPVQLLPVPGAREAVWNESGTSHLVVLAVHNGGDLHPVSCEIRFYVSSNCTETPHWSLGRVVHAPVYSKDWRMSYEYSHLSFTYPVVAMCVFEAPTDLGRVKRPRGPGRRNKTNSSGGGGQAYVYQSAAAAGALRLLRVSRIVLLDVLVGFFDQLPLLLPDAATAAAARLTADDVVHTSETSMDGPSFHSVPSEVSATKMQATAEQRFVAVPLSPPRLSSTGGFIALSVALIQRSLPINSVRRPRDDDELTLEGDDEEEDDEDEDEEDAAHHGPRASGAVQRLLGEPLPLLCVIDIFLSTHLRPFRGHLAGPDCDGAPAAAVDGILDGRNGPHGPRRRQSGITTQTASSGSSVSAGPDTHHPLYLDPRTDTPVSEATFSDCVVLAVPDADGGGDGDLSLSLPLSRPRTLSTEEVRKELGLSDAADESVVRAFSRPSSRSPSAAPALFDAPPPATVPAALAQLSWRRRARPRDLDSPEWLLGVVAGTSTVSSNGNSSSSSSSSSGAPRVKIWCVKDPRRLPSHPSPSPLLHALSPQGDHAPGATWLRRRRCRPRHTNARRHDDHKHQRRRALVHRHR